MLRALLAIAVLLSLALSLLTAVDAGAAEGVINTDEFIVVFSPDNKVLATWPGEGQIRFYDSKYVEISVPDPWNWEIYNMTTFCPEPKKRAYIPELDAEAEATFSAVITPSIDRSGDKIIVTARFQATFTFRFVTPPKVGRDIPLGSYIREYFFESPSPACSVWVFLRNNETNETTGTDIVFTLDFDSITVYIIPLRVWIDSVRTTGYDLVGNVSEGMRLVPTQRVRFCANLEGGATILGAKISINGVSKFIYIDGDPEPECVAMDVRAETIGNITMIVVMRTGIGAVAFNTTVAVEGQVVYVGTPRLLVTTADNGSRVFLSIPVAGYSYPANLSSSVWASVKGETIGDVGCRGVTVNDSSSAVVECQTEIPVPPEEVLNDTLRLRLIVKDPNGTLHEAEGEVGVTAYDLSSLTGMAETLYTFMQQGLVAAYIFLAVLYVITHLTSSLFLSRFLPEEVIRRALFSVVGLLAIFYVVIPVAYTAFGNLIMSIPMFSKYIEGSPPPNAMDAFEWMVGYYEKLFVQIETDYQTIFIGALWDIVTKVALWVALAGVFFIVGLMFSTPLTPGASIPWGAIGASLLSLGLSFLSIMISMAPMSAVVLTSIIIVRIFLMLVTAMLFVMVILGVTLIVVPSPGLNVMGERLLGSAIVYFIIFPLMAPLSYALYRYVIDTSLSAVETTISVSLPGVSLVMPIGAISKIMVFLVTAGMAEVLILVSVAYILTRSGLMSSVGEAFVAIVSRA